MRSLRCRFLPDPVTFLLASVVGMCLLDFWISALLGPVADVTFIRACFALLGRIF